MRQRAVHRKKPFSIGMRQRRGASQKTAEERFNMLARGWLAYPVTPMAHATTAEERLYMSSLGLQRILFIDLSNRPSAVAFVFKRRST